MDLLRVSTIRSLPDEAGDTVWNLEAYPFLADETAPPSVNPSLWRQSRLNANYHGLFKVTDGIYQIRGFDLSVMSIVETDNGYLVIDPLITPPTARAGMELVYQHLGRKPIVAVIYTHSHIDHWGGVKGVISEADVQSGRVKVIAPDHFMEFAISENVIAGNVMSRRASYMYGNLLPKERHRAGWRRPGADNFIRRSHPHRANRHRHPHRPNHADRWAGNRVPAHTRDGSAGRDELSFSATPRLCMAENVSRNMHNLYTLRGAQVRNPKVWAHYIDEAIEIFDGRYDLVFSSHHWPTWGAETGLNYLKKQRDMYKYIHDETMRLANQGYTLLEIPEIVESQLPADLFNAWYNRGYYGTVSHNVKAVYQHYLGFFDGNPATLHPLPPEAAGKNTSNSWAGRIICWRRRGNRLTTASTAGWRRWSTISSLPTRTTRRRATCKPTRWSSLGYQAESGPWRNFYLSAAKELRDGVVDLGAPKTASPDVIKAMTLDMFFDLLGGAAQRPQRGGQDARHERHFTDTDERYLLVVENGVLNYAKGKQSAAADVTLAMARSRARRDFVGPGDAGRQAGVR